MAHLTGDARKRRVEAAREPSGLMSDAEGAAWDALHDDAEIICCCDGCNFYSPTYDEARECSLSLHVKAIRAAALAAAVEGRQG